jgi:hypothetical protein
MAGKPALRTSAKGGLLTFVGEWIAIVDAARQPDGAVTMATASNAEFPSGGLRLRRRQQSPSHGEQLAGGLKIVAGEHGWDQPGSAGPGGYTDLQHRLAVALGLRQQEVRGAKDPDVVQSRPALGDALG